MLRTASTPRDRSLAIVGLGILLATHFDFWRESAPRLILGIPGELLHRLAWMLGAYVYLLFFTARIWRSESTGTETRAP